MLEDRWITDLSKDITTENGYIESKTEYISTK